MADEELMDAPNQQVVREDGSGPGDGAEEEAKADEKPKRSSGRKAEEEAES